MRFIKILTLIATLSGLWHVSYNYTYDKVSANLALEAQEQKKSEIIIKPMTQYFNNKKDEEKEVKKEDEDEEKEVLNCRTEDFIFIGDCRLDTFKSVSDSINFNSVQFITSEDADYNWLRYKGLKELEYILDKTNGYYNIIFNPGILDLKDYKKYAELFNDFSNTYPNQNILILDSYPLDELKFIETYGSDISTTNDDIYEFNIDLRKKLNDKVHPIYAFQELIINGYETLDGYYLDENTSLLLLNFIYDHIISLQP